MHDAGLAHGDGLIGQLGQGGARAAGEQQLDEHGEVGAGDDLDIGDVLGDHHGLVERGAAEQVDEDQDAVGLLAHGGDGAAEVVTVGGGLSPVEGDDLEGGLVAGDHVDRARQTVRELSMSREDETDHLMPPFSGRASVRLPCLPCRATGSNHITCHLL